MATTSTSSTSAKASTDKLSAKDINFFYGSFQALYGITLGIPPNKITAFIGPSGCGKSTFLRTMNRMNEAIRNTRVEGSLLLDGQNLFDMDVTFVRRRGWHGLPEIESLSQEYFR